jgi:hypothetical protein
MTAGATRPAVKMNTVRDLQESNTVAMKLDNGDAGGRWCGLAEVGKKVSPTHRLVHQAGELSW